ncbi:DinB family protein [Terrabacter sp. Ter38]|uniref:DinB family protein n=1 Tax=Terrabacter sp. Ter38 TaxID=2926030 RepID=UPI002117D05E|nr:DinB family protein [Terrabacter sp. Ter38]
MPDTHPAPDHDAWLVQTLQSHREAVLWKLDGLSDHDIRRPLTSTGTNLLGLVRHLAYVEFGYLGETFGRPAERPLPAWSEDAEVNDDLYARADESRGEVVDLYRAAWRHGEGTIALGLDTMGRVPHWPEERAHVDVRFVLGHLVAETARHAGTPTSCVSSSTGRSDASPTATTCPGSMPTGGTPTSRASRLPPTRTADGTRSAEALEQSRPHPRPLVDEDRVDGGVAP